MNAKILFAFIAYFSILLGIGLISHKKQKGATDFIVGNRSVNFWLTALSAHASDMSAWLFMALPAALFLQGMTGAWIAVGLCLGMFMNWQFISKGLRRETEKFDSCTLSTYFERRFNDTTGIIRALTASLTLFFLTAYVASGLIAMGILLESVFGINYFLGLSIAMLVVVIYTNAGGFVTVAWTDTFQATFLLFVIVLVPFMAYQTLPNGFETIATVATAKGISLNFFKDFSFQEFLGILFSAAWGLGYFGQPHIITKFMGINDPNALTKSKYIGMTWQVIALTAAILIGIIGIGFFEAGIANPEHVFVEMVKILFNPFIAGFILCAMLAATMSTMDSQILVSTSVISEDFYKGLYNKEATEEQILQVARRGVILVTLFALAIAFNRSTTIMDIVEYAWTGLGCSFGPLLLTALYGRRCNKYGAMAGILVGGFIAATWKFMGPHVFGVMVPAMIPGYILSFVAIYVVSRMTGDVQESRA